MTRTSIRISGKMYEILKDHLFPGDKKESVALAFCGRHVYEQTNLFLVHKLVLIPDEHCKTRETDRITWSTEFLFTHLSQAVKRGWAVIKIHSHPSGFQHFSSTDDHADTDLFASIYGWMGTDDPHGSMVMLPDGTMFGRVVKPNLTFEPFHRISVAGDNLLFWDNDGIPKQNSPFTKRTEQTFGKGTTDLLKRLKIGVIGCSGTGSPTIEQLARLGVGNLVLIDPDIVETKNLNRILNTTMADAQEGRYKVDVIHDALSRVALGTKVTTFNANIYDSQEILDTLIQCDVLFGCVDSIDGRHLLNQISSFYLIPYFDLGVKITADGEGGIDQISGSIHYIQPGGSSLMSRGLYTSEALRAAAIYRTNVGIYNDQRKLGYLVNVIVESPAVISINMQLSSMAVNEFLARVHPYRYDSNSEFAILRISMTDSYLQRETDGTPDAYLERFVGRGNMIPFLNMPEFR
ncbi:MAG: ThiF family adenylyltransferase [Saprospiraceae bacterium]|nr:ThiF family adenylyltransferase [Saprospiraceae bacterium]